MKKSFDSTLDTFVIINLSGGSVDSGAKKNGYCRAMQNSRVIPGSARRCHVTHLIMAVGTNVLTQAMRNIVAVGTTDARDIFRQLPLVSCTLNPLFSRDDSDTIVFTGSASGLSVIKYV